MVTHPTALQPLTVQTVHFGRLQVAPQDVIEFLAPLPPFLKLRRFVLLGKPEEAPFCWLQSLEEPALALVVAPHHSVVAAPPPALLAPLRAELGLRAEEQPEVYVIISLAAEPRETTMNLLAPLYLCRRTGRARQIIVAEDLARTRTPLVP